MPSAQGPTGPVRDSGGDVRGRGPAADRDLAPALVSILAYSGDGARYEEFKKKFKSARTFMIAAYRISPGDPRLIAAWANTLQGDEHIAALQRALAIYDPGSREARALRVQPRESASLLSSSIS